MLDLLGFVVLFVFVLAGAWRGALVSGLSLLTLAASYAAALWSAARLGPALAESLDLPSFLAPALAGSAAFLAVHVGLGIAARAVGHWEKGRRGSEPRSGWDRLGGGFCGAVRGALVVVLIGWLGLWLDAARSLRADPAHAAKPLAEGSSVGRLAQRAVETGVEAALGDAGAGGKLAARVLARPTRTLAGVQFIVENPSVAALGKDRAFWTYVEHGAVDAALNRGTFYRILYDEPLRRELATVGLIDAQGVEDPAAFRREAKQVLTEVGPRLRRLREDPELQELAHDPDVSMALEQGNVLPLLRHPGFQRVVSRALAGSEPG